MKTFNNYYFVDGGEGVEAKQKTSGKYLKKKVTQISSKKLSQLSATLNEIIVSVC